LKKEERRERTMSASTALLQTASFSGVDSIAHQRKRGEKKGGTSREGGGEKNRSSKFVFERGVKRRRKGPREGGGKKFLKEGEKRRRKS